MNYTFIKDITIAGKLFSIYKTKTNVYNKYYVYIENSLEPVCTLTLHTYKAVINDGYSSFRWYLNFSKLHHTCAILNDNKSVTVKVMVLDYFLNYCIT